MQTALTNVSSSGIDLLPGGRSANLEYANDIVLFGESAAELQDILSKLSESDSSLGMGFAPSKCKMLLQDWVGQAPYVVFRW